MAENENNSEEQKLKIYHAISLVIIGLGIGWLAGLSVSPVATILISGLLGVAIAFAGIMSVSLKIKDGKDNGSVKKIRFKAVEDISIDLFAYFVVGIVAGVMVGVYMRTHNVLGVEQNDSFVKLRNDLEQLQSLYKGKKDGEKEIGLKKEEIARRILDKYYPKGGVAMNKSVVTGSSRNIASSKGMLLNIPLSDCKELLSDSPSGQRVYIKKRAGSLPELVPLLEKSDEELEQAIRSNCLSSSE